MDRSEPPNEAKSRLPIFDPPTDRTASSHMAAFTEALRKQTGQPFTRYSELHDFSIRDYRTFWKSFMQWTPGLEWSGEAEPVCVGDICEHARFFPDVRLNYAGNLLGFSIAPADAPALTARHADGRRVRLTRGELRARVARLADALTQLGLREGDRVAGVMRNDADAIVTALAVTAVGATLSTAAPEMGIETLLDRFTQLEPRFLFAHTAPQCFDTGTPLAHKIARLADALPSLAGIVCLDGDPSALHAAPPVNSLDALLAAGDPQRVEWKHFDFNHPLFVMFSSGTTGKPKCIVHGTGGSLIEHLKEHRLHSDLRPGDRLYFHTSCAWMMWNWQLSALASGVEIVTYDGPIASVDTLWRIVAEERVSVFGTSPAYLKMCEDAGLVPSREFDLGALRAMMSTGAILFDAQFEWVRDNVKPLQLQSISGGTDILGCFVLGNPDLPVYAGEAQCKSLGFDVQAWRDGARSQGVGDLVCVNPFPSRPLGFLNDPDGERFHKAYFSANEGVWTHGDQIEFAPEGTARLHGRSDGVLVVRGINVGPDEIYRVLNDIPEIRDGIVVQQRMRAADTAADAPGNAIGERLVLLVTLKAGARLTGTLIARIRRDLVRRTSAAHVPDVIAAVDDLPVTHSGKLTEAAVRNAVNGLDVTNAAALRNPASLDAIRHHPALQPRPDDVPQSYATRDELERLLQTKWEQLFAFAPIGRGDNFFELGGHSLLAARLLAELQPVIGRPIPLATMLRAPTIAKLADVIDNGALPQSSEVLVPMREGEGAPLFLVHSVTGSVLECTRLIGSMRKQRPVYGLQALGLDGETSPQRRVEDMAKTYVEQIRKVQPNGPYALAGFSFGGLVALEIAQQLFGAGEQTEFVCLLDTYVQERWLPWFALLEFRRDYASRLCRTLAGMSRRERARFAGAKLAAAANKVAMRLGRVPCAQSAPTAADPMPPVLRRMRDTFRTAMNNYRPKPYAGGPIVYVRAASREEDRGDPLPLWRKIARGGLTVAEVPGNHAGVIEEPGVYAAAAALDRDYGLAETAEVERRGHHVLARGA
ncbi:acetoacetyl-CoA synthetase [Caballeronia fortuita]|uniref:Acetoacetyl-CoA synthetase n=1 Tax=Caballeronia fortuita TaxID=1777138 RepID=A0A158A154_9BURK|nr:acetoacetate--CoA ligase [Caballeronia fortuita]SAK51521.1 acetoacetyl-CoA synthetase [Caballeronia fortuita]